MSSYPLEIITISVATSLNDLLNWHQLTSLRDCLYFSYRQPLFLDTMMFKANVNHWGRLNYATIHHHLDRHYQPKYIYRHHPPPAKIYPLPPITSQNKSTTMHHHPKMDHRPNKSQNSSYITSFWHCVNSLFFFEMR